MATILWVFLWFSWTSFITAADRTTPEVKTLVQQMEQHARERDALLKNYSVDRVYKVENKRLGMVAEESAAMIFLAPGEKLFEIRSQSGSTFLRRGVINRIIDTEQKNAVPAEKPKTAITSDNYEFEWLGQETVNGRPQYILHAKPRRKDLLLFDAKIWVDVEDLAVTRIEGRPAKNPSFWTRKVEFTHEYQKFGPFWLPVRNHSVAQVFLFGKTTTELEYSNYQINQPGLEERAAEIRKRGNKLEIQIDSKDKR
ncbi:MAG: outer membrane lipoprotein-sorting protein [Acidobacteriia bacterium]|nr:outer membrane lipoprotein-sorting protein [Terriglobia bacterium]